MNGQTCTLYGSEEKVYEKMSQDMDLIQACRDEFHRRLANYHRWKNQNTAVGDAAEQSRAPAQVLRNGTLPHDPTPSDANASRRHRFFRVPLAARPSDRYRDTQQSVTNGFWYVHFDGQYACRQFEMHPPKQTQLLVAGQDDLKMCELPLAQTGLTRKRGVEITQHEFDAAWKLNGGPAFDYTK